ncbi:MAG: hypothetical protein ABIL68_02130, partial [bacterium]
MKIYYIFLIAIISLPRHILPYTGYIQDADRTTPLTIPRINGPVTLDGLSNEPAWAGIRPLTFVKHRPSFGAKPTERSEVLIAHDDEYLYVAGRLYDREPNKIESSSKKRDSDNPNSQWFGLALDTFNDKENA